MLKTAKYWLIDTTLRDGEQSAGIVFSLEEKIAIATMLSEMQVPELEVGIPIMGEEEIRHIRTIQNLGLKSRITTWCRAKFEDINRACETNVESVHISFPGSEVLQKVFNMQDGQVVQAIIDHVKYATKLFNYVSIGLQDVARADMQFINLVVETAFRYGAHRIRLADSVGLMNPAQVFALFSSLTAAFPYKCFEFHGHNDLGMATANSIAALQAGAKAVSVTVNGLGERCGNAVLAEVVMAIKHSLKEECAIQEKYFMKSSRLVERASGQSIPWDKPIVGAKAFMHESGIHTKAMLKDHRSYEPFEPKDVGRRREEFLIGKHLGAAGLKNILSKHKNIKDCVVSKQCLEEIKNTVTSKKRSLTKQEAVAIYEKLIHN
ncbi:MAG: hypothetical protein KJ915_06545 [Candidatus Omnitrophica bacterium]|nr:hypothetical protein [Candidatus Omnitrophota bacterium]